MLGKAETLFEKYPAFFTLRIANKFYSQRQNIRCTQQGRISQFLKKFFCILPFILFYSFPYSKPKFLLILFPTACK
jgi:hypothetical protein